MLFIFVPCVVRFEEVDLVFLLFSAEVESWKLHAGMPVSKARHWVLENGQIRTMGMMMDEPID